MLLHFSEINTRQCGQLRGTQKDHSKSNHHLGEIDRMYTLPSPGIMRRVTVFPASLIRLTMSECDLFVMEHPLTANIRSPTFSFPQRSAGLPSIIRPILWGMATHALPAFVLILWFFFFCACAFLKIVYIRWEHGEGGKEKKGWKGKEKVKG